MKDFAESYAQKDWANACANYVRINGYIKSHEDWIAAGALSGESHKRVISYWRKRIAELEKQFPMLKG